MKRQYFALLLCLFSFIPAHADEMENFFSGMVPVNNRSQASFQEGASDALLQVLVRASVQPASLLNANTIIQQDLNNADKYAAQFSYQAIDEDETHLIMKVTFPEKIVSQLLIKAGVQYWPSKRRGVLLLPVINSSTGRHLITDTQWLDELNQAGQRYGLPMEIATVVENVDALWPVNTEYVNQLLMAHKKTLAVIVAINANNSTSANWQIIGDEQVPVTTINANNTAELSDKGIAWVANQMVLKDAVVLAAGGQTEVMTITNVKSYEHYEQVLAYLKQVSIVDSVSLVAVKKDQLTLNIVLKSAISEFDRLLTIQRKIKVLADDKGLKTYYWNTL